MLIISSNVNIDPLKKTINKEIYLNGFNKFEIDLIDETSVFYNENTKQIFIFIDYDEYFKEFFFENIDFENKIISKWEDLIVKINAFSAKKNNITMFINDVYFNPDKYFTYIYDILKLKNTLNGLIKEKTSDNVLLFPFSRVIEKHGYSNIFDEKYWYLGRIKLNKKGFELLGNEFINFTNAYFGIIKKVIIVDLDNTLWGGVAGEDGDNIKLSEDGIGKIYRDFQKILKSLKELGVILCINSKNNYDDVKYIFDNNSMMILKWDDFVIKKINWNNKGENIKEISQELNLGVDSFVFIDDSKAEREIVRNNIPEIVCPDFPEDISYLNKWFFDEIIYKCFSKIILTKEDINKTKQYFSNVERSNLSLNYSKSDFIKNLNIKINIILNSKQHIERIAQLTQKTNQFNMTTKRYSVTDVEYLFKNNYDIFIIDYEDKFGKEGITGEAIIKYENNTAFIDNFLMSCRIIGRGVEYYFIYKILKYLINKNIEYVKADFIKTQKNVVAENFYNDLEMIINENNCFFAEIKTILKIIENKFDFIEYIKGEINE